MTYGVQFGIPQVYFDFVKMRNNNKAILKACFLQKMSSMFVVISSL